MYIKVIHKILIYSWIFCHISLKKTVENTSNLCMFMPGGLRKHSAKT